MLHEDEDAQDVHSQDPQELSELRHLSRRLRQLAIDPQVQAPPDLHAAVMAKARTLPLPRRRFLARLRTWLRVEWDLQRLTQMAAVAVASAVLVVLVDHWPGPEQVGSLRQSPGEGLRAAAERATREGHLAEADQLYAQAITLVQQDQAQTLAFLLEQRAAVLRQRAAPGDETEAARLAAEATALRAKYAPLFRSR